MVLRRRRRRPGPLPAPEAVDPATPVLELRIHGVNNTAPAEILDLGPRAVECVAGDRLGSFWRAAPGADDHLPPDSPGVPPPGVVREAYSWGGLARTSPTVGPGVLGNVVGVLGRLGWTLLVPFGLVNVAFWTRPLAPDGARRTWQRGPHARILRLFAVGLTLLLVASVSVVALGLVATQCVADGAVRCAALPGLLDGLADTPLGRRLALLALVPIAVLALVAGLAALSRSRYEQIAAVPAAGPTTARGARPDGAPPRAVLATPGFWTNARLTAAQARVHVAAGLALVVLATTWYAVVRVGDACRAATAPESPGAVCLVPSAAADRPGWWLAVTAGAALLILVAVGVLLLRDDEWSALGEPPPTGTRPGQPGRPSRPGQPGQPGRPAATLSVAATATAAVHLVLLALLGPDDGASSGGASSIATSPTVPPGALPPGPAASLVLNAADGGLVLLVVALLALAVHATRWRVVPPRGRNRSRPHPDRDHLMWRGSAPGVLLTFALAVALALSTLLVVGTGDWLNGDRSAGDLISRTPPAVGDPALAGLAGPALTGPHLQVPAFFVWFGFALVPGLAVVGLLAWRSLAAVSRSLPAADGSPEDRASADPPWGSPGHVAGRAGAADARRAARRRAGMAHRAEPLLGHLATAVAVCLGVAAALTAVSWFRTDAWPDPGAARASGTVTGRVWSDLVGVTAWGAGALGLLVVAGLVGGAIAGGTRPLGLVWDLMCFLPRAGHPLGPPCYAERVVPELVHRYHRWLAADDARRLVVSAHSLGAVLGVASVLASRVELGPDAVGRTALLTHGTQLRPYLGRLFPELLGPDQLGTTPGRGPQETTPDPWAAQLAADRARLERPASPPAPGAPPAAPLRDLLTGPTGLRWISLWRRTDHLGFPVDRYVGSDVDRPAEEIDASGSLPVVATHGRYTRVDAYRVALLDLVARLRPRDP